MRRKPGFQAQYLYVSVEPLAEIPVIEPSTTQPQKQGRVLTGFLLSPELGAYSQVIGYGQGSPAANRHQPFPGTFALNPDQGLFEVQVINIEANQFSDTKP